MRYSLPQLSLRAEPRRERFAFLRDRLREAWQSQPLRLLRHFVPRNDIAEGIASHHVTAIVVTVSLLLLAFYVAPAAHASVDTDADGLSDVQEQRYGTDPMNGDTDGDSYPDGLEIHHGYDPKNSEPTKLPKRIEVDRKQQTLRYAMGPYVLGEHRVSTGKRSTPTPKGTFRIASKNNRAWSNRANLWMPKWMNFTGPGAPAGRFGIHELPEWRSGKKEGANHLGVPVSGGCVRLGVGPAQTLYAWADVGTTVVVQ